MSMQQQQAMSSQQRVVKQSTSVQQQSSSFSMQQSSVQQQSQTQTQVTRQVQQGVQRVQGPTQMVPVGLPAGASPPVFEQIFQNARFAQGGDALFEGKVQGSPKPTVTWTRRGQQISSGNKYEVSHDEISGVVTLLIRAIGPGDEGEYTCTAANQYGEAICTVYIQPEAAYMMQQQRQQMQQSSVQSQMHIQKQQQMQLMQNGYSESFRVDSFEHRLLHEVEFRQTLSIRLEGEVDLGGITIQGPPTAPQLQQKPRSTKVSDGGNATFTVSLHANPSPRVIWFKNGARIQQSEKYLITASAGQATLVIKNVSSADNGYYTMLAENKSGCTVASAQLAVVPKGEEGTNGIAPEVIRPTSTVEPMEVETDESGKTLEPKFALIPRDREAQEGKMVRFDCRVTGRPYPEVTWFLNGQPIIDDATHKVLVNEAGNHSLMITEVSLMDNGTITCVARNKSGEAKFQVALHVLEREQMVSPKFVERFQQGQVKEGETVVLHARAVGTPMPTMSWQKDGVAIENSEYMQIQVDGQGSSNLQIGAASVGDAGWYSCNASNVAGSTSTRARLHVVADKNAPAMPSRPHFPKPTKVIEPPAPHQPEIINLRPVERAHHQPRAAEEEKSTEAPKFTVPLRDIDLEEGKRAHFEAKLTPVGDATLNVEWLLDGRPLAASSRATTTYRFGYVALDILNVIKADTGVYTCRASNVMGQAEVSANLRISEKPIIDTSSQHTDAMKQINYLEQQASYQKNVSIEEAINIKPNFVKPLANLGEVSEGKYAHFEAQLHPVSDPFMRIEWFKDGHTITASSRINVIYNFGYVALNIMHLRPEDSGTYSVRATNKAGECTCTATIKVVAIGGVTGDLGIPEQSAYIKSVEEMEAYRLQMLSKQTTEYVQSTMAPLFKSELKDTSAREGGYAHFEARLEPIGDSGLRVDWFKDGRPLEASARITSFYNFGYVALTIKQLIVQDAGTYTCVATNTLGKAQVQCTLVVISKTEKEVDSHYSETVQKMEYMEDSSRYQRTETEETTVTVAPKFVGQMKGTNKIVEGQKAHFEVRLEPQSDSTMVVEWYFNSQVIMSASRIKLYNDFGYVSLDISDVRSTDSGTYTVVARNALGEAQLSTQMIVETRSSIDYSTMHEVTMSKTTAMERRSHQEPQYDVGDYSKAKPAFTVMLADPKPVPEGKNIHLEARLEPVGDPTMKVEWFFNGKPLTVGSRFKTYFDFGFVALDILSVYTNDSGEYTCRAENALGSAHTSAQVHILGTSFIENETMHGEAMEQISYLENRARGTVQEETEINQAPTFAKSLKNIETIEGTNIHLEARLQPVGDSSMRIEWFFNDEPLKVGHRFRPAYDFDYVALDLLSVYPYDSGIYTCRATNKLGQAVSSASVKITEGSGVIITNEQTTLTKEQLTMLEERNRYSRTEITEETTKQAPVFTTALKNIEILEGQRAHFEVRLIPTSDPTMKIEWFHDNKPIKSGSRFTEYNDFGFVALDIMYAYAEDSGTYTCVATNCLGQATSSCTLLCHTKESIMVDTMNAEAMSKITQLESRTTRIVSAEESVMQAPVFTAPMKDQNLLENAPLHFEARLIPVGDADLKVEWFKNGIPIQQANRITVMHDFGYVALDMKYVNPEDSGTYTCRATNRLGQAVTSATLVVSSKESLLMESQHSEALEKLRYLEDSSRYSKTTTEETIVTTAPRFTVQLSGLTQLWEGQSAHVECRLEPYPDPSMKVEWFHNGKPLNVGHRFRTMYDFGFCAMDILSAVAEDSGTYEVKATNRIGTATSSITIEIKAKSDFILDTQHPEAMSKLARLEAKDKPRTPDDVQMIEKPNFGRPLRNLENLIEGQAMHMEATLTPVNDATMKVEWFFNGKPIPSGHRFRTTYDFGFVALDLLYAYPEDSGTYMCKATNAAGQAVTSCTVKITEVEGMQTGGDEERMRKIAQLEASGQRREEMTDLPLQKPVFTTPLTNQDSIVEGDRVHLECRLEPINDPNLHVEWYVNGVEIKAGHRFRTTHDFGYVALDVLYAYAEDSGTYLCKATNKLGEAVNSCSVTVSAGQSVVMHSQVPKGMQQMDFSQQMEQTLKKYCTEIMLTQEDIYDIAKRQPPRFVTHIKDQLGLKEMEGAKFDCQLAPVGDPNMKVEWFFNGRPLPYKNRFTPIYDFGYVALQMNWVFGEDSGEYLCRATNKYGMDETKANLKSTARPGVIYDSQLPVGKMSLDKIRELEAQWDKHPEAADEVDKARSKPEILLKPENINCQEGEWARFSVRVSGHPRPRVMWIVNGNTAMSGNRFKIWYDGIYHLDIPKTRQYDSGKIEVMCRNALGQAYAACELAVKPRQDDYRAVLKNSPKQHEPGSKGYRKPDWVIRMEELKQAMSAEPVKPHFVQELVNSRVKEMGTITFTATIGGNPKPEVSWYLNQKLLHQHQFFQMRVRNDKAMLTIVNASPFVHKGEYQCKLYNSEGEAFSKARLDVIELSYEEKLNIEDERYAAVMIEHSAAIMKEKEQNRRIKEREDFKLSLGKMKEEKAQRQAEMQAELEAAKHGGYKPDKTKAFKPKEEVKEEVAYKTPTERRIAQVYSNWKTPVKVEESYPELEPEDFAPNQIPGVKCFVQVSETSVKGEEVVRDVAPQFFEDEQIIDELAKIHTMLKNHVKVSEIWHKFRAGEFKCLQQPGIQSALIKICEFIGHQRNVSLVLAQEAKEQSTRHPVGLKAFMRMLKFGSNIKTDKLFKDTIPEEMGKWSSTTEELKKVSQMINQGVETEEIIATCEAGKLASLKKPETQQPLINIVEKHGHSVMVAQVLVEEAYRDAKDERLMVDRAWEVVHEQELTTAEVTEVKTDTVVAPVAPKQHTAVPLQKAVGQEPVKQQHAPVETPQLHRTQTIPRHEPEQQQYTPVEVPTPQESKMIQMKPRTQTPLEPEPEPNTVQLKPTKRQVKPVPEPTQEQVQLKPTQRQIREVDQTSEDVKLKPTPKTGKDSEPQSGEVKLKPTRKPGKEVEEPKPETVQLKSRPKAQKEVEPSSEAVQLKPTQRSELPKVDAAIMKTETTFQTASASEVIVREEVQTHIHVAQQQTSEALEIATPSNVKMGDALRAVATYVADEQQENAMHLVEGERVYVQETSNSDWWFCKKHLTLEQGYVPAKLLAEEVSYTHFVQQKLNEKIMKLPVFDKLKKGVKAEGPSMPTKLSSKTVKDGQEVQFEVKVNGTPRPTITWFRQTAIIKPSEEFEVFYTEDNTATLVIKEVFPEDAGMFTCVAKNLAGVASSSAEMVVEGPIYHSKESRKSLSRESSVCDILEGIPPTFANRPTIKTVEEGAQIEIDVRLVAIPEAEITWKKDGQVLRESQRLRLVKQKDVHAYRLIIIIKGAKTDDIGTYEIIAKNREGCATNKVQLRVVAPQAPKVEEKFKDQTVEEEGTIRLVAKIHGVPCPDVNWSSSFKMGLEACTVEENSEVILECRTSKDKQCKWYKGKTELKASQKIVIEHEGLTHRLIINQAQASDAGKYLCQFDTTKTFCNLTVKTCEDFVERLQDVEVLEKEQAVLQVQVNNDKAKVTWHKDGEEIDQHNKRFKLLSEGNFRKLVLATSTLHDEGEYTCVVGDHECTCELTVRELPAEITRKMKDQVVPKGGKASFEVELTKGDAVITWYMDEKEVRFSDHYQLSIDGKTQRLMVYNCKAEDCGTYKAVVGKSECTATLKVELQDEGDFVKKLPPQMDINFGTDATFVVEISKDFSVEWYRQEQKISASDKYVIKKAGKKRTLIVKNVSQADAVEYSCILANLKTSCKLNVVLLESAPSVDKQYSKQEIVTNKGQDAILKVPFKATPKPKAFWYHKGQLLNVDNSPKYVPTLGDDCASLTVKTLENQECGEYQCKLCNGCGAAYADFTVKLLDKPSAPGQAEPVKVTNETVTLNWTVPQEDGGRKITNYKIEHRNIKEQNWVVWNQTEIVIETTVVVTRLVTNEEYMFRIAAVNEIGISEYSMESKSVKVCEPVQPQPPNFTQRMQAAVTGLNQELVLKCVVSGTPVPNVEWFQDGKPITNDIKYENFTATYTIRSTHEHSGGMYMCKASNSAGYAECSATVIVQEAPKFEYEERLQCQRLNVGENYNVPLKVIGHPKPKISWSRNDKPLKSSDHIQIRHEESEGMTTIGIKNLTKDDSSIFTITSENSAGKSQISLNLRVVEEERAVQQEVQTVTEAKVAERPSPPIGPLQVSEVSTVSCRLTWKASSYNGGMDITSYYIERKEKSEKQFQKLAEVGPNVYTYVVQNLRENCEYFFRVFACNPLGVSDSLEGSVLIKSAFEKPGPPLGPFDLSNMTESSLNLAWEEPEFNGGSPITGYLLEMRESTKKAWKKIAETKEKQAEVTGVKKGTQYCFRVFAINSVGQGPAYAPEEPITAGKKITPPGPPTSLQVIDITTKTVTLAWAPPTTTGGADLIGYIIERRMQGEKKWEKVNTVDPSVTLFCVEQLREQSEYEFRVFAENPVGMSSTAAMTEMVRLKTHATPPTPPTAPLEVRPTGPNSMMIEWGMPESDGGAPLLGYVIAIRDIKRTMWIEVGQVDANFTRLHIKELQEEHEYHVRVFARNEVGSSGPLETEDPVKVIKPTDFVAMPEDDNAPSLSYSTTETLSWMREAGMDADIYSYARGRLLNRDEYFFKVWHHTDKVKSGSPKPE